MSFGCKKASVNVPNNLTDWLFPGYFELRRVRVNILIAFYKEALDAWQKLIFFTPETKEQILDETIWNNRLIRIDGFSVYYKQRYKAGIIKISDIFRGNSSFVL